MLTDFLPASVSDQRLPPFLQQAVALPIDLDRPLPLFLQQAVALHQKMVKEYSGVPGVVPERVAEGIAVRGEGGGVFLVRVAGGIVVRGGGGGGKGYGAHHVTPRSAQPSFPLWT